MTDTVSSLKNIYMTVTMDVLNCGFNFCCWMTTQRMWIEELKQYPNGYAVEAGNYLLHIHCNCELTNKILGGIAQEAETILSQQSETNSKRKLANR